MADARFSTMIGRAYGDSYEVKDVKPMVRQLIKTQRLRLVD